MSQCVNHRNIVQSPNQYVATTFVTEQGDYGKMIPHTVAPLSYSILKTIVIQRLIKMSLKRSSMNSSLHFKNHIQSLTCGFRAVAEQPCNVVSLVVLFKHIHFSLARSKSEKITQASQRAVSAARAHQTDSSTLSTLDKSTYMCHSKKIPYILLSGIHESIIW